MPPYGLYSLANTPEELLSRGYGLVGTEFSEDPAFGNLTYNTSYNPAPYTGAIPFQNVFRISEGVSNNFDNPSYGGSGNPRFNQFEPEGILSQVDSRFPLYDDFTVAEEGGDLEDNAVTVDELGNLKQPSGIEKLLSYAPFGENSILKRVLDVLPQMSPEAKGIRNFYSPEGLTSTGSIASGIMKGYNPVYGGFLNKITGGRFGQPTQYGLAGAMQRRIEKILGRKAAQTDASRAKVAELRNLQRAEMRDRADRGESLGSIGRSTFTGKGMAFEKRQGTTTGKGTANERNYGGR